MSWGDLFSNEDLFILADYFTILEPRNTLNDELGLFRNVN